MLPRVAAGAGLAGLTPPRDVRSTPDAKPSARYLPRQGASLGAVVRSPQLTLSLFAALCLVSWGCDRAPSADGMPEWKPGEHHSYDDDKMGDPKQGDPKQ